MIVSTRIGWLVFFIFVVFAGSAHACLIVGDLDGNCRVDIADLLLIACEWLTEDGCVEQGLVGRWRLDETVDTVAVDSSESGLDGVVFGEALWNPAGGRILGALQFDGIDDYVEIEGFWGITGSAPRSCAAWIKTAEPGELITWGDVGTTSARWIVRLDEGGLLRVEVGGGYALGSSVLADDMWHHVAVVSDGTTTDAVRLYIDGKIEVISDLTSQTINTLGTQTVKIGVHAQTQRYYKGLMDDVRIYDRALTSGEIWALAVTGTTGFSCVDLNADDTLDATDFSKLAEYWKEERPPVIINEFLAENDSTVPLVGGELLDGNGESSDWIEIFNNTTSMVDLSWWHLTDEEGVGDKWWFPEGTILGSGDYLIVFASSKKQSTYPDNYPYVDDDGYLHTNFKLSNNGEYLALIGTDGSTAVHEYNSFDLGGGEFGYPWQQGDISYGYFYGEHRYFSDPTPGTVNRSAFDGLVETPVLSPGGGCYSNHFYVTISCPTEEAIIRYTTDRTVPTLTNGKTYRSPLYLYEQTTIMVKAFKAGYQPSETVIQAYLLLEDDVKAFTSNLPIVVIDTLGKSLQWGDLVYKPSPTVVIDTDKDTGRAVITAEADFASRTGFRVRGRSSSFIGWPKIQYALEVWDENEDDVEESILGFPAESDYILLGPYSDKSLIRTVLPYMWSNEIGRYAVRTRMVEMFLNTGNGKMSYDDYRGVYALMEKIKRDEFRVDITRLDPSHNSEPEITGGYLLRKDWGESPYFTSDYGIRLEYREPKSHEITQPQKDYIKGYIDEYEAVLYGDDFADPVDGYARYIDVGSLIDHHLLVEITLNRDAYYHSTFMYKDRGGKLYMGPVWDYNLTLGNFGGGTDGWVYTSRPGIGYDGTQAWYLRLMEDPEFELQVADRWFHLREKEFDTDKLMADIDSYAALLDEAQERNFERWPILGKEVQYNAAGWADRDTYQKEIDFLKEWLQIRIAWLDSRMQTQRASAPPNFYVNGSLLNQGGSMSAAQELTISDAPGTIYYTLDGTDPRSRSGSTSSGAVEYSDPIEFTKSSHIKARSLSGSKWSALNEAFFTAGPVAENLRITEIMYHPADSNTPEVEFVELTNIGDASINLNLVQFTNGIDFTFGDVELAENNYVVIVSNEAAFLSLYDGFTGTVAGEYTGSLDNGGERITLVDATGQKIHNFTYSDDWYDLTDGDGFSLAIKDASRIELDHVEPGLAAHWKLDEYNGQTAYDSSPFGHDGVVNGDAAWRSYGGRINGALEFDGQDDYVEITGYKGILGSNPRTCTAWIKTTDGGVIMNWGAIGVSARWRTVVDANGRLRQEVGGGAIVGSTIVGDGKWHHVAVASDGGNIKNVVLYVDGKRDVPSSVGDRTIDTQPDSDVTIGAALDMYFAGLIDNVCLYDRVLSDAEIALLAESDDYWEDKRYWRPSAQMGGSPGEDDPDIIPELGSIVINEVLAHSHSLDPDWIELYNTTDSPIDIGGWFLSDSDNDYMKYRIPNLTIIPADDYKVFYETDHFGGAFALSENGDEVYVRSGLDNEGNITGYYEEEIFDASVTNIAFGRYQKSTGAYNFVAMSQNTPGNPNAYPLVDAIVISEIMYNPAPGGTFDKEEYEYVELYNAGASAVTLQEYDDIRGVTLSWQFDDGIYYVFPLGTTIAPGEHVLVVRNLDAFAERYSGVTGVQIFGPYDGKLSNGGEKLDLSKPGDVDQEGIRHYIRVDRLNYNDSSDWPQTPDGQGDSLTRINNTEYGNDPVNWQAATPTPGL